VKAQQRDFNTKMVDFVKGKTTVVVSILTLKVSKREVQEGIFGITGSMKV
jgi:hypothetical protein